MQQLNLKNLKKVGAHCLRGKQKGGGGPHGLAEGSGQTKRTAMAVRF